MSYPIVLFDVDGTLLDSSGAGKRSLQRTFLELHGIPDAFSGYDFVGCTDLGIVHDAFSTHLDRVPTDEEADAVCERYLAHLEIELARPGVQVRMMPGIRVLLERLVEAGVTVGMATGNLRRGAYLKIGAVGLGALLPFGGFGSDSKDRAELTRLAGARGREARGEDIPSERVLVVGDSPLDIQAGHAAGMPVLSVLTGWTPEEDLLALGPEHLLADLSDTDGVMRLIVG
ncbi:MAG: HAD family hydrolase [Pseudomonadota bacterium]